LHDVIATHRELQVPLVHLASAPVDHRAAGNGWAAHLGEAAVPPREDLILTGSFCMLVRLLYQLLRSRVVFLWNLFLCSQACARCGLSSVRAKLLNCAQAQRCYAHVAVSQLLCTGVVGIAKMIS
jgi:hypothetical protein